VERGRGEARLTPAQIGCASLLGRLQPENRPPPHTRGLAGRAGGQQQSEEAGSQVVKPEAGIGRLAAAPSQPTVLKIVHYRSVIHGYKQQAYEKQNMVGSQAATELPTAR
jgi:hypothetical protein